MAAQTAAEDARVYAERSKKRRKLIIVMMY
jgi:hypothetical protein